MFNIPKFNVPQINTEVFKDFRDPDEVTREILEFLRQTTIEQAKTSRIQYRINLLLTITTVIIGFVALKPIFFNENNNQDKIQNEQLSKLIDIQEQNNLIISELSSNLLYVQNQVQTLEKQIQETSKN